MVIVFKLALELNPRKTYIGFLVKDEDVDMIRKTFKTCIDDLNPSRIKISSDHHHIITLEDDGVVNIFDEENYTLLIKDE